MAVLVHFCPVVCHNELPADCRFVTVVVSSVLQLQTLIQEADPGADYRIDRALNEACESVIQTACKHIRNGDPM